MLLTYGIGISSVSSHSNSAFLSRVSILRRDIDTANMSVRYVPVSDENSLTYRHSFSPYGTSGKLTGLAILLPQNVPFR